MYKRGDLRYDEVIDARGDYNEGHWVFLPHSCQDWVIGGEEEVKALIGDLQRWLESK